MSTLGPIAAVGLSGEGVDGSVVDPERHAKARMETIKKIVDQANHTAGNANITPTFHNTKMMVLRVSCAHLAIYVLSIISNASMYRHAYKRDMNAQMRETSTVVRIRGSSATCGPWSIDRLAKNSGAERPFRIFHCRGSGLINNRHESVDLSNAGPTFSVVRSSEKDRP